MVFSKLFKKGDAPPPPVEPETDDADEQAADEAETSHDARRWSERARDVIPTGASTGSKRFAALYGEDADAEEYPTHFVKAAGCRVVTTEGDSLIDCTMAL